MTEEELTAIENAANDYGVVGKEHVLKLVAEVRRVMPPPESLDANTLDMMMVHILENMKVGPPSSVPQGNQQVGGGWSTGSYVRLTEVKERTDRRYNPDDYTRAQAFTRKVPQ